MAKTAPSPEDVALTFIRRIRQKRFWAQLLSGFDKVLDRSVPTLEVRLDPETMLGVSLVINPDFLASNYYEDDEISLMDFYLAHEGVHIVQRHIQRWCLYLVKKLERAYKDIPPDILELANIAADLATNCMCVDQAIVSPHAGFTSWCSVTKDLRKKIMHELLPTACWPHHWDFEWGLSMEQYLNLLLEQREKGGGGKDDQAGTEEVSIPSHSWIDGEPPLSETELEASEKRLAQTVKEAVRKFERVHGRGSLPGSIKELFTPQVEEPVKIPWQVLERRSLRGVSKAHETEIYSRPNRRLINLESAGVFPYPRFDQLYGAKVAFIIDTSASMRMDAELQEAYQLILSFMQQGDGGKFWIVHADTQPARDGNRTVAFEVKKKSDIPNRFHGRGGTAFGPPIQWVLENLQPDIIKYATDGFGPAPTQEPPVPITWFLTSNGQIPYSEKDYRTPVPYGTVIKISSGEVLRY